MKNENEDKILTDEEKAKLSSDTDPKDIPNPAVTDTNNKASEKDSLKASEKAEELEAPKLDDVVVKMENLVTQFLEGKLSKEELEVINNSKAKSTFDLILKAKQAEEKEYISNLVSVVGPREKYNEVIKWFGKNATPEEVNAFNKIVVDGNDFAVSKMAIENVHNRYIKAKGNPPAKSLEGHSINRTTAERFTPAEYIDACRHYKYKADPEYRKMVESKRPRN